MELSGQHHDPAALPRGKGLVSPQSRFGRGDENKYHHCPLLGIEPPSSSYSHYTDILDDRAYVVCVHLKNFLSRSVGRALGCGLDGVLGFDSRRGLEIFPFTTASRTSLGPTQPLIQWVPGALSLRVKRPGREADHSTPSSTEVKEWVELYFHSPIRLHAVVLS
jgi:hypothetical protein